MRKSWLFALPALAFAAIAVALAFGLWRGDPGVLPSVLAGQPVPEFDLPALPGRDGDGLASADLSGEVALVNVFASWCGPCRIEHPVITRLAEEQGITVHAINYKDRPDAALSWLNELGDPYARVGADESGRVAIDWGVYGVPETYVVDADGRIVHRHVGPVMPRDVDGLLDIVAELRG